MHPRQVTGYFKLQGSIEGIQPIEKGHINDTFRIINGEKGSPDYLLQRVNHHVFHNISGVMMNIWQVTGHIKEKVNQNWNLYPGYETLTIISTSDNKLFHQDEAGDYWRVFLFLEDLKSFDTATDLEQVYEGAKTFGTFLKILSDFPIRSLHTTIPDFHNVISRLEIFRKALESDALERRREVQPWADYILEIADQMSQIEQLSIAGKIPSRVTHNDCKFNNVLFDERNRGRCVIDLDTVMPGLVHYDFGDGIRTTVSTASEDEENLDLIQVDLDRFEAFASGYLEATRDILSPVEVKYLGLSGPLFSYLMGVRFLTDYLEGDHYYKVQFEGHNFRRAKCQLELTRRLLGELGEMERIVEGLYHRVSQG